jgi:hypothetical protein
MCQDITNPAWWVKLQLSNHLLNRLTLKLVVNKKGWHLINISALAEGYY